MKDHISFKILFQEVLFLLGQLSCKVIIRAFTLPVYVSTCTVVDFVLLQALKKDALTHVSIASMFFPFELRTKAGLGRDFRYVHVPTVLILDFENLYSIDSSY